MNGVTIFKGESLEAYYGRIIQNTAYHEMLDRMGVKIVLDSEHLSEEDKFEAEKNGASVVLKKVSDKEDKKDGKDE